MKKGIYALIFTLYSVVGWTQNNVSIILETSYNTFAHNSLSEFQEDFIRDIDLVTLKVNDDYPANFGYALGVKVENINTQFFVNYNATGGKISYSDFSGTLRVTELLKGYSLGGEYQVELSNNNDQGSFLIGFRGFVTFSKLELNSYSKIQGSTSEETIYFAGRDFGLGLRGIYDIPISIIKLRLHAGYDFSIGGKLIFSDDRDYHLQNNNEKAVKTGWSGLRAGLGIVVPL